MELLRVSESQSAERMCSESESMNTSSEEAIQDVR